MLDDQETIDLMKNNVENCIPGSFLRMGDAEAFFIIGDTKEYLPCLEKHLSWKPSLDEIPAFQKSYFELWKSPKFLGSHPDSKEEPWAKAFDVLGRKPSFSFKAVHRFTDPVVLKYVLKDAKHVSILGCVDVREPLKRLLGKDIDWYEIPARMRDYNLKFKGRYIAEKPPKGKHLHYPYQFEKTLASINVKSKGHVFLLGAGILKPFYAKKIEDNGGIMIDLGSVMDEWKGVISRVGRSLKRGTIVPTLEERVNKLLCPTEPTKKNKPKVAKKN